MTLLTALRSLLVQLKGYFNDRESVAAASLSVAAILLATVVPAMLFERIWYSPTLALTVLATISALWAVVLAGKNLRMLDDTRRAELMPLLDQSLHIAQPFWTLTLSNLGKGAAVDVSGVYWTVSTDGRWIRSYPLAVPATLKPQDAIPVSLKRLSALAAGKGGPFLVPVMLHYRHALSKALITECSVFRYESVGARFYREPLADFPRADDTLLRAAVEAARVKLVQRHQDADAALHADGFNITVAVGVGSRLVDYGEFDSLSDISDKIVHAGEALNAKRLSVVRGVFEEYAELVEKWRPAVEGIHTAEALDETSTDGDTG